VNERKARVLVVEDSASKRELLVHILDSDPRLAVVGTARNGEEAIAAARELRPDVITMDVVMPKLDGLDATRRIMETCPTPIVIVSGASEHDKAEALFQAIDAGALAFVATPNDVTHPLHRDQAKQLRETVLLMSEVRVVRRWPKQPARADAAAGAGAPADLPDTNGPIEVVAIGASTGGPVVLKTIMAALPGDLTATILIVQHITAGFGAGFAEWLAQSSRKPVHVASSGELPLPGHAYLAPDGSHMTLERNGRLALSSSPPENGHRPSVSALFRSVAEAVGRRAIGVLLTGMGKDGARELRQLRDLGAVTIAQDQASSVVHGMAGEAIHLQGATYVLPPERIAATIAKLAQAPDRGTIPQPKNPGRARP
jgi:two-component system chemotaxis response regulator CheB